MLRHIRIIAGQWRGKKLAILPKNGLRPTSSRWRETIFNWLAPVIPGAHVLDCFAGSGALGLEALSRGASYVRWLEINHLIVKQINTTLQQCGSRDGHVLQVNTLNYLKQAADQPFNLVFLDPPFYGSFINPIITYLEQYNWLAETAWIYVESESSKIDLIIPKHWDLYREKIRSQVAYRLFMRN